MSAFVCSDLHISIIAMAIATELELPEQDTADYLKALNIESVNHRYNEKTRKTKCKLSYPAIKYNCHDIAKLMDCFVYQSSEKQSIEFHAIDALMERWKEGNKANPDFSSVWTV
jgi:hypothetical protein